MTGKVLVLGASGRFGRHAEQAFKTAGWQVRCFDRGGDLVRAARGADVIVNGWNPPYARWQAELPDQTEQIIAAAKQARATVLAPANVYVYGPGSPRILRETTPHTATNPLARARRAAEMALRSSGVRVILLRAGDFLDDRASGNWFDRVMIKGLSRGRLTYPGPLDAAHAWAWLPDLARAAVQLAGMRRRLRPFEEVLFPGYTLTGKELAEEVSVALDRRITAGRMSWLPLRAMAPVWPFARHLVEMRYLWSMPHQLDAERFNELRPGFRHTAPATALASALRVDIDPHKPVARQALALDQRA